MWDTSLNMQDFSSMKLLAQDITYPALWNGSSLFIFTQALASYLYYCNETCPCLWHKACKQSSANN
jgi:hypothetical protein